MFWFSKSKSRDRSGDRSRSRRHSDRDRSSQPRRDKSRRRRSSSHGRRDQGSPYDSGYGERSSRRNSGRDYDGEDVDDDDGWTTVPRKKDKKKKKEKEKSSRYYDPPNDDYENFGRRRGGIYGAEDMRDPYHPWHDLGHPPYVKTKTTRTENYDMIGDFRNTFKDRHGTHPLGRHERRRVSEHVHARRAPWAVEAETTTMPHRNLTDWEHADDREHITVDYRDRYGGKPKAVADRLPYWQGNRDTATPWRTHLGYERWEGDRDHDERMYRDSKKYRYSFF